MKNFSVLLVAALAFAGCKKKGAAGGADCDTAINHSMELAKADMQKMGNDDAMIAKMKDIGIQHCKDDKWGDDALKCMVDAKTETDAQGCYSKLTKDQQDKMNAAAMAAMKPAEPPAGSAGAAMGSAGTDTGSAMAGSAAPAGSAAAATGSAGSATH